MLNNSIIATSPTRHRYLHVTFVFFSFQKFYLAIRSGERCVVHRETLMMSARFFKIVCQAAEGTK